MPKQNRRSTSFRKVKKKLPGGRLTTQYLRRKPSKASCSECGKPLKGVPRAKPKKLQNMAKTKRRPERPYGGKICSPCMRKLLISKVRNGVE